MAAATVAAVAAEAPAAAGSKKKLVIGVVLGLVVAAAAYMFLMGGGGAADVIAEPTAPEEGAVVTVGQMTTSLAGPGTHFVRVEIGAVLNATTAEADVEAAFPLLRDAALSVLMGFDADTLRSVAGADTLRTELTAAAQEIWEDEEVLRIVLTDLLVQ